MVDSFRLRATVVHNHSQAVSWLVFHCLGNLSYATKWRPFLGPSGGNMSSCQVEVYPLATRGTTYISRTIYIYIIYNIYIYIMYYHVVIWTMHIFFDLAPEMVRFTMLHAYIIYLNFMLVGIHVSTCIDINVTYLYCIYIYMRTLYDCILSKKYEDTHGASWNHVLPKNIRFWATRIAGQPTSRVWSVQSWSTQCLTEIRGTESFDNYTFWNSNCFCKKT